MSPKIIAVFSFTLLIILGIFFTQRSLAKYSSHWSRLIEIQNQQTESLYIPSPVEAFLLNQTPNFWEQKWGPSKPIRPEDIPTIFSETKTFAENDAFYINIGQWELGRVLSAFANTQHTELLKKIMEISAGVAKKPPSPPRDWETKDCDILFQEFYFRLYQIMPEHRALSLQQLSRCDATSPSTLWVKTDSLKEFSGPRSKELTVEIKKISLLAELRPYRRWFADQLFKIAFLMQNKTE